MMKFRTLLAAFMGVFALAFAAIATPALAETKDITITIKDHKFVPAQIRIKSGEKIRLVVVNEDPTPEEFESHDLDLEKIIRGGRKGTFIFGPLEPGTYKFFGEFNEDTAQGVVIVE